MKSIFYKLSKALYCFVVGLNYIVMASEDYKGRLCLKENLISSYILFDIDFNNTFGSSFALYYFYHEFYIQKNNIAVYISNWLT